MTITPPKVKIPDNSERGTRLAKVAVRWSNGKPFSGEVRLTKNPDGICQLSGMELQLGRDTTKGDDYRTSVCTVTAIKEDNGIGQHLGAVLSRPSRPDAGSPCTKRSTGRGRRQHCRASSAGRARTSPMLERAEDDRLRGLVLHKEEAVECHNTGHVECLAKRNEVHAVPSLLRHRVPISELLFQYILLAS